MAEGVDITEDLKKPVEILYLSCSKLTDHPMHMGFYVESHLEGLTFSIQNSGLLEPLVVCPTENGEYCILSGHYRVRAIRRLRWKKVLCRVVTCDTRSAAIIYCTSNLLTRGVSAIEEAYMISRLVSEQKFTLSEIGKLWGRSKSWVSRRLGLLVHLEPKLKKDLGTGHLSPRVAQELMRLPRGNDQGRVLDIVRKCHLNKDEAAQLVHSWLSASEEEKQSIEESGYAKEDSRPTGYELSRVVEAHFSQCVKILAKIIALTEDPFKVTYWPMEVYRSFRDISTHLEDVISARFNLKGV